MTDRQCPSCGGFCKKSGCERVNVAQSAQQREEFELWAEQRGWPWHDRVPVHGPTSPMSETIDRYMEPAWETWQAAQLAAAQGQLKHLPPAPHPAAPAPSDTAREYMTGYSDGREWAGATNQAQQAQSVPEPVLQWCDKCGEGTVQGLCRGKLDDCKFKQAQPERAPLTDAEIEKLREKTFSTNKPFCPVDSKSMRKAVRAIEAAHGIKQGGQHD